jgi:hypothetical protein
MRSSLISSKSDRPSTKQQQTAIAPNLNQKLIASNIHTSTTPAIAPQPTTSNIDRF